VRFQSVCYRAHDPKWAFAPLSGEGARLKGGRFNAKGQDALYLALTIEGMFLEMGHGLAHRFDPLTVCCYDVDVSNIADLRTDADRNKAGVSLSDLACPWALDMAAGRQPASWTIVANLLRTGHAGLIAPSFARGTQPDLHHNLILWKWGPDLPHRVTVQDPNHRLPGNQSSWQR
jgi:RES domain-containing protein